MARCKTVRLPTAASFSSSNEIDQLRKYKQRSELKIPAGMIWWPFYAMVIWNDSDLGGLFVCFVCYVFVCAHHLKQHFRPWAAWHHPGCVLWEEPATICSNAQVGNLWFNVESCGSYWGLYDLRALQTVHVFGHALGAQLPQTSETASHLGAQADAASAMGCRDVLPVRLCGCRFACAHFFRTSIWYTLILPYLKKHPI